MYEHFVPIKTNSSVRNAKWEFLPGRVARIVIDGQVVGTVETKEMRTHLWVEGGSIHSSLHGAQSAIEQHLHLNPIRAVNEIQS